MLYVSEGCQAGGCPVAASQRQQKAAKASRPASSAGGGNNRLSRSPRLRLTLQGIALDASLEYSALN